ncbi:MAG: peptidoglycan-binding domain-containing protein [Patescibacteria group bacterium]
MKKLILGLAVALALVASAPAHAATVEDLQAEIDALLAQLQGLSGGSSASCFAFTRDLTVGASGADVTELQNFLAAEGFFSVAATGYFGSITQASVAAWQSANGVAPATGYFGAISRAKYNSMCTTSTDDDSDSDSDTVSGGESDLNNFEGSSGNDSDVEEGGEAEVMDFEFDVDEADAEVERVDVMFKSTGADGDTEPWEVFDEITLLLDGDEVGSADGSDEDNWDEDEDDEYRIRFTNVDSVVDEDSSPEFTVMVGTQNNIDDVDSDVAWTVWVPEEGVRALDGEGIDHTIGDADALSGASDEVEFDIDVAGEGEELTVSESDNNPDATVLELEDDEVSDWMEVLVFTLAAEDNDIEVSELPLRVIVSSSTYAAIVNDAMLVIDGEEFDDLTASTTLDGGLTFDFDNEELVVEDGEEVEVSLQLEFNALTGGNPGMTVTASVTSDDVDEIEAEGADDLIASQLKGSATGDAHTLRTDGVSLAAGDMSASGEVVEGNDNDQATYTLEFEVTAFGDDFYIPFGAVASTTSWVSEGVSFDFLNGDNDIVTVAAASTTANLDSTADEDDSAWVVREGDTETFTLTVDVIPGSNAPLSYKVLLQNVYFRLEGIADTAATAQAALPESDYRTNAVNVLN